MKNLLYLFTLIIALFSSCKSEPKITEFPILSTLDVTDINENGVTFHGQLLREGLEQVISYGFVWNINGNLENPTDSFVIGGSFSNPDFEKRINYSLVTDMEYNVRTFARYSDKIIYGNAVIFKSKGSEKSTWKRIKSEINLAGWYSPVGAAESTMGHILFQNTTHYVFNPETETLTNINDIPFNGTSGTLICSANISNKLYVLNSKTTDFYSIINGSKSDITETPRPFVYSNPRSYAFSISDSLIYFLSNELYAYNVKTRIWTKKTLVSADEKLGCLVLNNMVYTINTANEVYQYNPVTNVWTKIATYPGVLRSSIVTFANNNKIYFGLTHDKFEVYDNWLKTDLWSYNISTKKWLKETDFPIKYGGGKNFTFFFSLKNMLYFGFGSTKFDIWKYNPLNEKE